MALSKDKILKHTGRYNTDRVHVPAWRDEDGDDVVIVRGLTIREWEMHTARAARMDPKKDGTGNVTALLITRCVLDEDGMRVFSDSDADQINELGAGEISELSGAILRLSGLTDEDAADAAGESEATQTSSGVTE